MLVIPVFGKLRQEDCRFAASLSNLALHNLVKPCFKIKKINSAWWCTLVIPVLGRLRQEDRRFEASLSNLVRTCFKIKNKK